MALDGNYQWTVRVTDSVLSTTFATTPLDAKEYVKNAPGRFTILDPTVQPPPPPAAQAQFLLTPPCLGSYLISALPTVMPGGFGVSPGGAIPTGSTAVVTNAQTAPVLGAVPSTTGAVTVEVVWNGAAWGYG